MSEIDVENPVEKWGPKWQSVYPWRKPPWVFQDVLELAKVVRDEFDSLDVAPGVGRFTRGDLKKITPANIRENQTWLKVVILHFPDRMPSSYLLADSLLLVDKLHNGLFYGTSAATADKQRRAIQEGVRQKRLLQKLRRLCKRSQKSKWPDLEELKQLVRPLPDVARTPSSTPSTLCSTPSTLRSMDSSEKLIDLIGSSDDESGQAQPA